jgi:hypothetical protein
MPHQQQALADWVEQPALNCRVCVLSLAWSAVVDFRRLWAWDDCASGGEGVSIWRPVPPPGYAALGDCLVRGMDPPPSACVVQDTGGWVGGAGLVGWVGGWVGGW